MDALVESVIREMLTTLGVVYSAITPSQIAGQKIYTIESQVDGKALIGSHGDTVFALDTLIKRIVERRLLASGSEVPREDSLFLVDVNGYRAQKIKDLEQKALMMADRARSLSYDVELEPMSGYERLIVHSVLAGQPNIATESQGEGRTRRIVIRFKPVTLE